MIVTIFKNVLETTKPYYMEVDKILERIKNCKIQKQIDTIRAEKNPKKKRILKEGLPSIIFAGKFTKREDKGCLTHSGLCILDFDKLENVSGKKDEIKKHPFVYAAFISPSGNGLKVLVRIPPIIEKHKRYYYALMKTFTTLDATSQNISRVCFESVDADIYINTNATEYTKEADEPIASPQKTIPATNGIKHTDYTKVHRALNMVRQSGITEDDKHITLLKASKLMGGYISGGLVEEFEGVRLLETEIQKKDIDDFGAAQKTIKAGIEYGKATPIEKIIREIQEIPKSTGIKTIDSVWEKMKYTFIHGKERGKTTHFTAFDANFTWKSGEITLIIGKGNSGKTEFMLQLMLLKSYFDKWKWGVFSPENYPEDEFYDGLIHSYIGKTTDPFYKDYQMSMEEYERGYNFVREHFFYVYPEQLHSVEEIEANFLYLIKEKKINGTFLDPFNQIITKMEGKRDDQFLSAFLTERKLFSVKHNLCNVISTHPKNMTKNKNGEYDVPDIFDISGGAMWGNKADNIISVHRPYYIADPKSTSVEIHVKKIKKQRLVGVPGVVLFDFNRKTNRFYMNGISPLENNETENKEPINFYEKEDYTQPIGGLF